MVMLHSFFFLSEFIFSPVLSVTCLPITLFFKDAECHHHRIYFSTDGAHSYFPGCPNTVITKGDDFFQVQEPSHDLMLHLVVMTL